MEKHNYNYKNYTIFQTYLTLFLPMFPFDPREKNRGFLMFSGGSNKKPWEEKG